MIRIGRVISGIGQIARKSLLPLGMVAALNGCAATPKNILASQISQLRIEFEKEYGCVGIGISEVGAAGEGFARNQAAMFARKDYIRTCLGEKNPKNFDPGWILILENRWITDTTVAAIAGTY